MGTEIDGQLIYFNSHYIFFPNDDEDVSNYTIKHRFHRNRDNRNGYLVNGQGLLHIAFKDYYNSEDNPPSRGDYIKVGEGVGGRWTSAGQGQLSPTSLPSVNYRGNYLISKIEISEHERADNMRAYGSATERSATLQLIFH